MITDIFIQIFVAVCFIGLIIILFFEKTDYISYSILLVIFAAIVSVIFIESLRDLEYYIAVIEWDVIFFLIAIFIIVKILEENKIFDEIGKRVVRRYSDSFRKMFYVICIVSTLLASIVKDLSFAMISGPIIVIA
ncbi:MAG: hypothetical protein GF383_08060 [Candidatus Lokiarchaeota archaeon]|nr:hypothetical protein [Candidatus Lokiarchaeota archaeon]MBD3340286.1 hypothetical protein [Candidatus Lokiarchaeota archaeon]